MQNRTHYPVLHFSSTPTFFVAICKIQHTALTPSKHTYIIAGCEDTPSSTSYIFSAVGKQIDDPIMRPPELSSSSNPISALTDKIAHSSAIIKKAALDSLSASLGDEKVIRSAYKNDDKEYHLQYQAYEISYQHYENYIRLLKAISPEEPLTYYFCSAPNEFTCSVDVDAGNPLLPENKEALPVLAPEVHSKFREFNPLNTCRHAAIEMLHQLNIHDDNISSLWLSTMSRNATIKNGKTITPLFILPIPPDLTLKTQEPEFYKILSTLHQDILRLSTTNYSLDLARQKFQAMRELYKQLTAGKHDQETITNTVSQWKKQKELTSGENNNELINKTRQNFLFPFFNFKESTSASTVKAVEQKAAALQPDFNSTDIDGFENITIASSNNRQNK